MKKLLLSIKMADNSIVDNLDVQAISKWIDSIVAAQESTEKKRSRSPSTRDRYRDTRDSGRDRRKERSDSKAEYRENRDSRENSYKRHRSNSQPSDSYYKQQIYMLTKENADRRYTNNALKADIHKYHGEIEKHLRTAETQTATIENLNTMLKSEKKRYAELYALCDRRINYEKKRYLDLYHSAARDRKDEQRKYKEMREMYESKLKKHGNK